MCYDVQRHKPTIVDLCAHKSLFVTYQRGITYSIYSILTGKAVEYWIFHGLYRAYAICNQVRIRVSCQIPQIYFFTEVSSEIRFFQISDLLIICDPK